MSRIGKAPIALPTGVSVSVSDKNVVTVKGPKGELSQQVDSAITVKEEDGNIVVTRPTEQKRHKALHGLYRSLLNNMVVGVTEGYKTTQELVGVGYRATSTGNTLELALGYSHPIVIVLPQEVKVTTTAEKGKNPTVTLESIDKQLIGQVAAKIRSLRKPEPYKGKGVKFAGEVLRRKAGKSAKK
ncbi:50S ribosomal protein L6 [Sphingobacterium wenxiniae]|uniref:Large ribosomal subunit protein uL6 n=1 Tax=Sphingobacterium wenxiniae TaxID=683125 RepID=A0A1I6R3U4_9SPHI|nr:50S ribosomal protein L6 [Sphingobacterium wenxiniae]SFS59220.1 large subunit ribosomal protein L6 [Sphingobacterium wenxiniae]